MNDRQSVGTVVGAVFVSALTTAVTTVVAGSFTVSENPVVDKTAGEQFLTYYYDTVTGNDKTALRRIYENSVTDNARRSLFGGTYEGFYSRYHERIMNVKVGRSLRLDSGNNIFQVHTVTRTASNSDNARGEHEYLYYLTCSNKAARFKVVWTCNKDDVQLDAAILIVQP